MPISKIELMDCMEGMKQYPDKYFDIAIVDPPYGIGAENGIGKYGVRKFKNSGKNWDTSPPRLNILLNYLESVKIK